jgi:isochorismate synthase
MLSDLTGTNSKRHRLDKDEQFSVVERKLSNSEQSLLNIFEGIEPQKAYLWENPQGLKVLGYNPLSGSLLKLFEETAKENYLNLDHTFSLFLRSFEEATPTLFFFQYAFIEKKGEVFLSQLIHKDLPEVRFEWPHKNIDNKSDQTDSPKTSFSLKKETPNKKSWQDRVEKVLEKISQAKEVSKVVLKRNFNFSVQGNKSPQSLFINLRSKQEKTYNIFFPNDTDSYFYSFSPEALFTSQESNTLSLVAIAGTRKRGLTEKEDLALEKELLGDDKEQREHHCVIDQIKDSTKNFGVLETHNQQVLKLKGVQHLKTPLTLKINSKISLTEVIDLATVLHPTPAVCGTSTEASYKLINELEGNRGFYAGLLGLFTKDYQEATVLIRSLTYNPSKQEAQAHGGAGIVAGSTPEKEWEETKAKIESFLLPLIEAKEPKREDSENSSGQNEGAAFEL